MGNVDIGTPADDDTLPPEPHPITDFKAVCDCPSCGYTDAHYLRGANSDEAPATTQRTCTQCGETWGQK
ncbi:hypothetical protein E3G52_000318 [Mycobacteroides abscessus]|nr:hypothetical protein [Mycobacteroides abscessus]